MRKDADVKKPVPFLSILTMLASCASNGPSEGPVRLGQTAFVSGPKVRADRIIEDSRCPGNVQCVWAGRLVLAATVFGGGWSKQVELTLGVPVDVADGKLTLVGAVPAPRTGKQQGKPAAYRFTFNFQGGL